MPRKRGHRHWSFWSQRTRLLCSAGLSYSLLTHIILHQFIRIKQTEGKKEARSSGKKRIRKRHWQRLSMKRKSCRRSKEGSKEHWEMGTRQDTDSDWEWKKKEFAFTSKGVRLQACVFPLLYVGSLCVYMYMKSYKQNKLVSGPWRLPHWSFYRLYRGSVLLRCGEVAFKWGFPGVLAHCAITCSPTLYDDNLLLLPRLTGAFTYIQTDN